MLLLKFWIHLPKEAQKKRLTELERIKTSSRHVTDGDWNQARLYSKSHGLWEHTLRETSTGEAPWYVVEGTDARYRDLTVGGILLDALTRANLPAPSAEGRGTGSERPAAAAPAVIDNVKLFHRRSA